MERYEAYKDSGVEWIGEVPASWRLVKNKYKFAIRKRIAGFDGPDVLSITQQGIRKKDIKSGEGQLAASYANYQWVFPGDFAMNHMDLLTGWVDCSSFKGVTSPDYRVFCPIAEDIDRRFYKCLFQHCYTGKVFYGLGQGVSNFGRWRMPADQFNNFVIPVPPLEEQRAIADFLDEKTTEIDSIISETERSIELLREYRKSVISEAVTKGLDPNAPMKDSGVEWIGEIPEGWKLVKTLYGLECPITDGPHETPEFFDEGIPFVSAEAVSCGNGRVDFSHMRGYISEEYYNYCCEKYIPRMGDIYMIKSGATTGRVAIVDTDDVFTIWSPLAAIRCDQSKLLPKYAFFYFQSEAFQRQVENGWSYGTQQNIGMRTLEQLLVCYPSLSEQETIADYLDAKTAEIDALIADKERQVELLKEYRKSLISEAVTGKFKVPGVR